MPKSMTMRVELTITSAVAVSALQDSLAAAKRIADDQPWNDDAKECVSSLEQAAKGLTVNRDDREFMPLLMAVQEFAAFKGPEFAKVRELAGKALKQHRKGMSNAE